MEQFLADAIMKRMELSQARLYEKLSEVFGADWENGPKKPCARCGKMTYLNPDDEEAEVVCFMCKGAEVFGNQDDDPLDFLDSL
jgi:formylmethanofuran dehydrogenase subunit E